jgi:hypothetical protein
LSSYSILLGSSKAKTEHTRVKYICKYIYYELSNEIVMGAERVGLGWARLAIYMVAKHKLLKERNIFMRNTIEKKLALYLNVLKNY